MFAVACLLATVLAAISFRVLEQPIRASATLDRYKSAVVATGLASSLAFGKNTDLWVVQLRDRTAWRSRASGPPARRGCEGAAAAVVAAVAASSFAEIAAERRSVGCRRMATGFGRRSV